MYFLLAEIIQPINCILVSEEVPNISIILSERRSNALKGIISKGSSIKGNFYTKKPNKSKPSSWSFENTNIKFNGEMILLKDDKIWHPYQNKIKSHEVNKVLFSSLSSKLSKVTNETDLLKATSGFFKIETGCYGGRINKV
ncbi:Hypothetical protein P9515_15951 [Prochlorococcus marinus str. MIT 9515]|uniref:Uncharacterized protein n=1 Tax=Prochlorococcus marinus (strain MIT 9515) TaxID=167542 RepID=A2BYE1_PROM5|nr:hypothetical protein [Prochlorococcus marinus]ABM72802.1 Hypothetical protein P9515_15951 [Prochlorococcus marinus str. MIT 9515]